MYIYVCGTRETKSTIFIIQFLRFYPSFLAFPIDHDTSDNRDQ
jgi:hypothetical protein